MVLRGANENMNVKRDFKAIGEHMKRLVEEGPMMWTDLRIKSRSAAGPFDLGILDKVRDELVDTGELREIEKEEQVLRGLRKPNQTGPVAHWYIRGPRR